MTYSSRVLICSLCELSGLYEDPMLCRVEDIARAYVSRQPADLQVAGNGIVDGSREEAF